MRGVAFPKAKYGVILAIIIIIIINLIIYKDKILNFIIFHSRKFFINTCFF